MKLRISDRILTALVAIGCLLLAAAIVAESVFGALISQRYVALMSGTAVKHVAVRAALVVICLLVACLCLRITCRRRVSVDTEFVEQKTDNGPLRVSVKAIEGLVWKCVNKHNEMVLRSVQMMNRKDGLSVLIVISTAADISIPLAVTTLQRQLREYVMESTGVDLRDIHVDVDDAQADLSAGTYRLHDSVIDPEEGKHPSVTQQEERPASFHMEDETTDDEPLPAAISGTDMDIEPIPTSEAPEQTIDPASSSDNISMQEPIASETGTDETRAVITDEPEEQQTAGLLFPDDDDLEVTLKPNPERAALVVPQADNDADEAENRLNRFFHKD